MDKNNQIINEDTIKIDALLKMVQSLTGKLDAVMKEQQEERERFEAFRDTLNENLFGDGPCVPQEKMQFVFEVLRANINKTYLEMQRDDVLEVLEQPFIDNAIASETNDNAIYDAKSEANVINFLKEQSQSFKRGAELGLREMIVDESVWIGIEARTEAKADFPSVKLFWTIVLVADLVDGSAIGESFLAKSIVKFAEEQRPTGLDQPKRIKTTEDAKMMENLDRDARRRWRDNLEDQKRKVARFEEGKWKRRKKR